MLSKMTGAGDTQWVAVAGSQDTGRSWQQHRSELNLGELSNQFIVALDGQAAFLASKSVDPIKIRVFVQEQLPRWPVLRSGFNALLNDFEDEMSPKTLFSQPPLSRSHSRTRGWLAPLAHELWRIRSSSEKLLRDARDKLAAADAVYHVLLSKLGTSREVQAFERFKAFRADIERLASACRDLSAAIHQFPREVRVT